MPQSNFLFIVLNDRSPVVMPVGDLTMTLLYIVQTYDLEINLVRKEIGQKVILVQDSSDPATGLKEINNVLDRALRGTAI